MARISTSNLIQLLRRVGVATDAGIDARTTWSKESQHGPPDQREHIAQVHQAVARGDSLANALASCNGYFPPLVCDMIDVGEQTGQLDIVIPRLIQHYEHLRDLKRIFLQGIALPALKLLAALIIVGLLIWILGLIGSLAGGQTIDVLGLGLVGNQGLLIYICFLASVGGVVAALIVAIKNGHLGTAPIRLAMSAPLLGKLIRDFCLARFSWTLALALGAGADARRSLHMALRSTQNPLYLVHAEEVDQAIQDHGVEMHEALRATGAFPDDFLHALESAELAGAPTEALEKLAQDYQQRAKTTSQLATVAATFAVGGLVGLLIIALIFRLAYFYVSTIYDALEGI